MNLFFGEQQQGAPRAPAPGAPAAGGARAARIAHETRRQLATGNPGRAEGRTPETDETSEIDAYIVRDILPGSRVAARYTHARAVLAVQYRYSRGKRNFPRAPVRVLPREISAAFRGFEVVGRQKRLASHHFDYGMVR